MKQNKLFFLLVVCSLLVFSSCEESEELNLLTYPENQSALLITDAEGNSEVTLKAIYNAEGEMELDGQVSRTYVFRFDASPEDIMISYELISKNIPEELISISKTEYVLPKGASDALVDVSFLADDFSFAQTNYAEETYELGVRAIAKGYKVSSEPLESKVIIQKEAFSSSCFIVPGKTSKTIIEKPYLINGEYLDDSPIIYPFTIQLDKPAINDLKIKLILTGSDDEALDKVTFVDEIVIPKGQKVSEDLEWKFDEEFLLQSELDEYTFSFSIELEDQYFSIDEDRSTVDLIVRKVLRNISYLDRFKPEWQQVPNKNKWSVELLFSSSTNPKVLIDGRGGYRTGSLSRTSDQYPFIIDMSKEEAIKGVGIDYYYDSTFGVGAPRRMKISTSLDKKEWVFQGEIATARAYSNYAEFLSPLTARYIKFELFDRYDRVLRLTEVYVYK